VGTENTVEQSQELIPQGIGVGDRETPVGRRVGSDARQRMVSLRKAKSARTTEEVAVVDMAEGMRIVGKKWLRHVAFYTRRDQRSMASIMSCDRTMEQ
jgi:hypothetical protein